MAGNAGGWPDNTAGRAARALRNATRPREAKDLTVPGLCGTRSRIATSAMGRSCR